MENFLVVFDPLLPSSNASQPVFGNRLCDFLGDLRFRSSNACSKLYDAMLYIDYARKQSVLYIQAQIGFVIRRGLKFVELSKKIKKDTTELVENCRFQDGMSFKSAKKESA
jgi:hypothetical protein